MSDCKETIERVESMCNFNWSDAIMRLFKELVRLEVEKEREACAKLVESAIFDMDDRTLKNIAKAIRNRSNVANG